MRRIFLEYLSGRNLREIAEILNAEDTSGRIWKYKAVDYILQNERYAGNALLQKRYTTATLPKQQKINHGEREMYYVADSNEAIIPQELFDRAKELRQKAQRRAGCHPWKALRPDALLLRLPHPGKASQWQMVLVLLPTR